MAVLKRAMLIGLSLQDKTNESLLGLTDLVTDLIQTWIIRCLFSPVCMIWYDIYLAAIGLTPGGSSTAHIYTQQYTEYKERNIHNNHKIEHA